MTTNPSWKLVPLAAVCALGLLILSPEARVPQIEASVASITAASASFPSGGTTRIKIIIDYDDLYGGNTIVISVATAGGVRDVALTIDDCDPNCREQGQSDDQTLSIDSDVLQISLTLTATCSTNTIITVKVEQRITPPESDTASVDVVCIAPNIKITKKAGEAAAADQFDFTITAPGTHSCENDFNLKNGETRELFCDPGDTYTVKETVPAGWVLDDITCTRSGGLAESAVVIDKAAASVKITPADDNDAADCTFTNKKAALPTPAAGPASQLEFITAPSSVACDGVSFVTIVVKDAGGNRVADGTNITLAVTPIGSIDPTTAQTQGGQVTVVYKAPASGSGTATVSASAGGKTGAATIAVSCGAQSTPAPAPASIILPPSTGDAGLQDRGHSSWPASAAATLIAACLLGGLATARRRG